MFKQKTDIKEVKLNPKNPRTIRNEKFLKLVDSIKEFPEMLEIRPIVVDNDNVVLGGNMRLKACQEAGLEEVWIIKATDLTDSQIKEFIVKDNVNYGEWDYMLLQDNDSLNKWGMDLPNWEIEESDMDEFFDDFEDDDDEEIVVETETKQNKDFNVSFLLFMLEKEDYELLKSKEAVLLEKIGCDNLSEAFKKLVDVSL